ncbi:PREDICTED: immunoglobulin iota chain-like [Chrysochloris asiatica]|uniref:immunoglobulin iota chain-like n=1 Tax=Chrysochloris asiatica TaxID=185453 RepID=UPI0003F177BC|nr:PREDICTED: immunoglobulin iota chain-like [Chrysochloris asiatica]
MPWVPVLLMLLTQCTGCDPQPVLHQPPLVTASLGTTVRVACTLSNDYDVSIYNIYWYQQRPGQAPKFLLRFFSSSNKNHGQGIPFRFSGSKDMAMNTGYLSISKLQAEDEAVYFCAVGSQNMDQQVKRDREQGKEPVASGSQAP